MSKRKKPPGQDEFDFGKAKAARDDGIERVMRGEDTFRDAIGKFINNLPHDWEGIFEDIRIAWYAKGGEEPHAYRCWGAVSNAAVRRGMLIKTGAMRRPTAIKSHSRPTNVFRRP